MYTITLLQLVSYNHCIPSVHDSFWWSASDSQGERVVNTWESQQLCNIYQKKLQPDEELNGVLYCDSNRWNTNWRWRNEIYINQLPWIKEWNKNKRNKKLTTELQNSGFFNRVNSEQLSTIKYSTKIFKREADQSSVTYRRWWHQHQQHFLQSLWQLQQELAQPDQSISYGQWFDLLLWFPSSSNSNRKKYPQLLLLPNHDYESYGGTAAATTAYNRQDRLQLLLFISSKTNLKYIYHTFNLNNLINNNKSCIDTNIIQMCGDRFHSQSTDSCK